MKIESQGEIQVCIFKRFSLKRKKKNFLPALYCIYTETIQAHVFSKKLQFPVNFFYKSFLAAVDGNPATPAMNNLQYLDPSE